MSFSARSGSHCGWSGADFAAESVLGLVLGWSGCLEDDSFGASCAKVGAEYTHKPAIKMRVAKGRCERRFTREKPLLWDSGARRRSCPSYSQAGPTNSPRAPLQNSPRLLAGDLVHQLLC